MDAPDELRLSRRTALSALGAAALAPKLALGGSAQVKRAVALNTAGFEIARVNHSITALSNGTLLLVGGYEAFARVPVSSASLIDPVTGSSTPVSSLRTPRARHAAVLLSDGRVAVLGGIYMDALDTVEIFDPMTLTWSQGPSMLLARMDHSAAVVGELVFVTGGRNQQHIIHGSEGIRIQSVRGSRI